MKLLRSKRNAARKATGKGAAASRAARHDRRISVEEGIREGLEDAKAGRVRPADEFFAWFEKSHRVGTEKQPKRKSVPRSES
jgi:predicted transcriptional regulator